MSTLIVDAGNTRVTCASWEGAAQRPARTSGRVVGLRSPVPLKEMGSLEWPRDPDGERFFRKGFRRIWKDAGEPAVVLVSVVPRVSGLLPTGLDLTVVDHESDLPFVLGVEDPAQVGPDRLCNMAAAAASGLSSALVVDAGTATTFDVLLDGVFIGGMIAPGMAFAALKLGESAARLDPVPFGPADWDAGRHTAAAMAAGAWHTGVGGIRATVAGLVRRYGDLPIIVTGGLGAFLDDPGWYQDFHWTLRGAAILAQK